jgi:FimV-like protein
MDEYELARSELEKVAQTDDEDAKREAAMLLQKIEEQGH